MPDHKNFVGRRAENAFSPRPAMVFRGTKIYSHAGLRGDRLLIFNRGAQIDSADGLAKKLSKPEVMGDICTRPEMARPGFIPCKKSKTRCVRP